MKLGSYNQFMQYFSKMCCGIILQYKKMTNTGQKKKTLEMLILPNQEENTGHYIHSLYTSQFSARDCLSCGLI